MKVNTSLHWGSELMEPAGIQKAVELVFQGQGGFGWIPEQQVSKQILKGTDRYVSLWILQLSMLGSMSWLQKIARLHSSP